ncbi:SDR family NAD(P)-dependent oxidoreductase [Litorivivens sp.]|uniref:SDR family NAD(P)-dependent oxidoreductase n=1 Tax=Litorivivens sp. TaxID=2020868 RepID=UPI00356776DE
MHSLKGKTAFITGASRGIGRAIATRFAAEGASVVLCASRLGAHGDLQGTLEEAVAQINASGGNAAAQVCNLLDETARADLIAQASQHFGPIDILVNNAATSVMNMPSQVSTKHRNRMFDLNVNVPVELAQQALAGMRERGAGWVLNLSSATINQPTVPYRDSREAALVIGAYGASKAALARYSEALAHELAPEKIYVNTLAPEAIVLTSGADYVRNIARNNPDMVEPVEMMAEAALALCSRSLVGLTAYSRQLVHSLGLEVHSLDGTTVLGDAFAPADVNTTV